MVSLRTPVLSSASLTGACARIPVRFLVRSLLLSQSTLPDASQWGFLSTTHSSHRTRFSSPFCMRAKSTLASVGADCEIIELDQRADGPALQRVLADMTGRRTVPNVFIGGKSIGGADDTVRTCLWQVACLSYSLSLSLQLGKSVGICLEKHLFRAT